MAGFIYRCPITGQLTQGWIADAGEDEGADSYRTFGCLACRRVHLVNPTTGRVAGADGE